ncbi:MAG: ethanolamine ammonia-lyase reactivating factor EutA, partial [Candidatus Dormibacteraeota bacterium]|nr:ethanolamine ammonia-lyase reactivating factor EutA [Candidatus Dormibacteraeota bacterium]
MPRFLHHEGESGGLPPTNSHLDVHFPDHHGDLDDTGEETGGTPLTWDLDNVELTTVGVDVGSSTSHLLFARLHLQRLAQGLSSRFVVVRRDVLYRSPVTLTPYRPDGLIDVDELSRRFRQAYEEAGVEQEQVDTGAVILTGVALERENSRAVAELFADTGGRFVCASAGHNLEAILAAHGSGAAVRTARDPLPRLHLDVGGGTTKLALL